MVRDYQSCFVATAVYGSEDAREVEVLREFRDNILEKNGPGRAIVRLYYGGLGRATADFIEKYSPSVIPVIKVGLDLLVERYSTEKN
jgi:hypothetical protein